MACTQVEPKTPDLEDFGISSVTLQALNNNNNINRDDAENASPNVARHAIADITGRHSGAVMVGVQV